MKRIDQIMKKLLTSDSKTLIRTAMDSQSSQQRSIARGLMFMDGGKWDESKHPRRKDGKFTSGSGSGGGSSSSSSKSESSGSSRVSSKPSPKALQSSKVNHSALVRANREAAQECARKARQWPEGSNERHMYEQYADTLSKPLAGRPTPEQSKALTEKFLGNISSKLKPAAVERYKRDLANEPQITSDLCDISDKIGTGMFGLDFRLKKASDSSDGGCRIADKIQENLEEHKADPNYGYEQAVADLSDMVRYTQACTPESMMRNFEATSKALEAKGYKPVKVKNTWETYNLGNPYRGVNCVYMSPTGTKFELQFHTAESLVGKEVQHGQYEEFRDPRTAQPRKNELAQLMYNNMKSLRTPKDIGRIKKYPPK